MTLTTPMLTERLTMIKGINLMLIEQFPWFC
jgi:hypothetical protein